VDQRLLPGTLWYLYEHTRDPYWRTQAERWTTGLDTVAKVTTTHDLGFVLFDSFGHQWRLTQDPRAKAVLLEGSATLAKRFNPAVGAIKSWDIDRVADRRREWEGGYPVIVDNLMNLEMLFWAARNGGDPALRTLAERHALTSMRAHVRDDGSVAHVALFDPTAGKLLRRTTWQGINDSSAWARGQGWAIYGLGAAARETGNRELLAGARRAADYFLAHLPAEGVPFWDFRHPALPNTERDASAAAIAASGLLALTPQVDAATGARYRAGAERMLTALASGYLAAGTPNASVLLHTVGDHPQHREIDVGMIYADYYFVEALLRWRRRAGAERRALRGAGARSPRPDHLGQPGDRGEDDVVEVGLRASHCSWIRPRVSGLRRPRASTVAMSCSTITGTPLTTWTARAPTT
jgi:hypothetical protein